MQRVSMLVGKMKEATRPDVTSEAMATVLIVHNKLELTARGVVSPKP